MKSSNEGTASGREISSRGLRIPLEDKESHMSLTHGEFASFTALSRNAMSDTVEQIWNEYHSKLYAFIHKRVNNPSLADDIRQEIFLKIHSRIGTLTSANKIHSWIYQIARNTIVDYYRTRKPEAELPESLSAPAPDPGDTARREIADGLAPMIRRLPAHYRESVMMSEIEGLTQAEVAARQNISLPGAKSRIQRGRLLLKDMLLQCCRFEFDGRGRVLDYEKKKCDSC